MPQEDSLQFSDSFFVGGVDAYSTPDKLSPGEYAFAMNVCNRGGIIQTRPGTKSLLKFDGENFQGFTTFTPASGVPHLISAVDGYVYVSAAPFTTYRRLPNVRFSITSKHVCFESCLKSTDYTADGELIFVSKPYKVLMMQDGDTRAAFWDGSTSRHLNPTPGTLTDANGERITQAGLDETFIGLWMKWSGNRLWVSRDGMLFASDIGNPLKFTEAQYINEGRAFYLPGECTGMIETPEQDGLIVFTIDNGTLFQTSIQDRNQWLSTPNFQKIVFSNIGCAAPLSLVKQYGLIWWFSPMGLINSDQAFALNRSSRIDIQDNEMMCSKGNMGPDISGVCACSYENYLLCSVPSGDVYNRHTWCLDQAVFEGPLNAWNSYWTGWRPVQWAVGNVNGVQRVFFASKDYNGCLKIWEANLPDRNDNGGPITCFAQFRQNDFGRPNQLKRFTYAEINLQEILGDVSVMVAVGGRKGGYTRILTKEIAATEGGIYGDAIYDINTCMYGHRPQTRIIRTQENVAPTLCNKGGIEAVQPNDVDLTFGLLVVWSGRMGVAGYLAQAVVYEDQAAGNCEDDETHPNSLSEQGCADKNYFVNTCAFPLINGSGSADVYCEASQADISSSATATSIISQADADRKAYWNAYAEANQICVNCTPFFFRNTIQRYIAACPTPGLATAMAFIQAGVYSSYISQADANAQALAAARAAAEAQLVCCWSEDPQTDASEFELLDDPEAYSGADQYGLLGIEEIRQDDVPWISNLFNWTICPNCDFADGPEEEGATQEDRYATRWFVRSATAPAQYGIDGAYTQDVPADLFVGVNQADIFTISIGFDGNALPAFAIQTDVGQIEIRRSVAGVPTTYSFAGDFPRLFYDGILQRDSASLDLVCFYVIGGSVKMRFQRDNFGIEYDFITTSPDVVRVTKTDRQGPYQLLYFTDTAGSYRVARSEAYPPFPVIVTDPATNSAAPSGGEYLLGVVDGGTYSEAATNSAAPAGGEYVNNNVAGGTYVEPATDAASPAGGEYTAVIIDGGTYSESATNSSSPQTGEYTEISVNGGTYTEDATNSAAPSGGEYAIP